MSTVHYVTARDAGRTAILAGPFTTAEAAGRHTPAASAFLTGMTFTDTIGAFVPVGVTAFEPRPGTRPPRARFHAAITGEVAT